MADVSKFLFGIFGVLFVVGVAILLCIDAIGAVFWIMQHTQPPST